MLPEFLGYDPRTAPKTIAERIIAFRVGKGEPQARLAVELKIDTSTLAKWEQGKRAPSSVYAERVAALLGSCL